MSNEFRKCPFCGGEVSIALMGNEEEQWWMMTRGHGENACDCRLFMESEKFYTDADEKEKEVEKQKLIQRWNMRKPVEESIRKLELISHKYHYSDETDIPQAYYDDGFAYGVDEAIGVLREMEGVENESN